MPDCERKNKLLNGCKFEPRYSTERPSDALVDYVWAMSGTLDEEGIDPDLLLKKKVYVCDVCWCGKTTTNS